jgi:hypothetical protein
MLHGEMVRREMKNEELVRGETIIRGNVPNPPVAAIHMAVSYLYSYVDINLKIFKGKDDWWILILKIDKYIAWLLDFCFMTAIYCLKTSKSY